MHACTCMTHTHTHTHTRARTHTHTCTHTHTHKYTHTHRTHQERDHWQSQYDNERGVSIDFQPVFDTIVISLQRMKNTLFWITVNEERVNKLMATRDGRKRNWRRKKQNSSQQFSTLHLTNTVVRPWHLNCFLFLFFFLRQKKHLINLITRYIEGKTFCHLLNVQLFASIACNYYIGIFFFLQKKLSFGQRGIWRWMKWAKF